MRAVDVFVGALDLGGLGSTHFKKRSLEKTQTEMSQHVLAYNLMRMIAITGVAPLTQVMKA